MRTPAYWMALVFIFTMPWKNILMIPGLGSVSRIIGLVLAGAWLLNVLATGRVRKIGGFHLACFLFFIWNSISIFWTSDYEETASRAISYMQMLAMTVILWDLHRTPTAIRAGLQAFVLGSYVPILSTLFNFVANRQAVYGRYAGAGQIANETAIIIALGVPVAWYLAVSGNGLRKWWSLRLLNYAFIPLGVIVIGLTATRFAMIMLIPAFAFGLGTLHRISMLGRVAVCLLILGGVIATPFIVPTESIERLASTGDEIAAGDLTGRTAFWKNAFDLWLEHPIKGIGSAAFDSAVLAFYGRPRSVHNTFIAVLAEVGIVGLALVIIILTCSFRHISNHTSQDFRFWLALSAAWLIGNMALTWIHNQPTWLFLTLLASSAVVAANSHNSSTELGPV